MGGGGGGAYPRHRWCPCLSCCGSSLSACRCSRAFPRLVRFIEPRTSGCRRPRADERLRRRCSTSPAGRNHAALRRVRGHHHRAPRASGTRRGSTHLSPTAPGSSQAPLHGLIAQATAASRRLDALAGEVADCVTRAVIAMRSGSSRPSTAARAVRPGVVRRHSASGRDAGSRADQRVEGLLRQSEQQRAGRQVRRRARCRAGRRTYTESQQPRRATFGFQRAARSSSHAHGTEASGC